MDYNWIQWADVKAGSKEFESAEVESRSVSIINEACQVAVDDLSGYYDINLMTVSAGVPKQLVRLAMYKARELASIVYWGAPSADIKNESAAYFKEEYRFLLESIRNGFIEVEGFNKKSTSKAVNYY